MAYVGGQTGSFAGTLSDQTVTFALTGGLASVPAAGDFVIITYAVGATLDWLLSIANTGATAYTLLGTEGYATDTYDINRRTAYRVMPGTPETQFVLSSNSGGTSSTANAGAYTIHVFRGIHETPLEQAVQQGSLFNTSTLDPGSITPTTAGTVIYVVGAAALATGRQGVYTSSDLTGFLSSAQDDTNAVNIGAGYFEWSSGTFSPATFGGGGSSNVEHSGSWLIAALAPAPGTLSNKLVGLLGQPLARHS